MPLQPREQRWLLGIILVVVVVTGWIIIDWVVR
jgi:type II secretory pathway component PulM